MKSAACQASHTPLRKAAAGRKENVIKDLACCAENLGLHLVAKGAPPKMLGRGVPGQQVPTGGGTRPK